MKKWIIEKYGNKYYAKIRTGLFKWVWIRYGNEKYPDYYPFDSYEEAVEGAKGFLEDYGLFGLKWKIRRELKPL